MDGQVVFNGATTLFGIWKRLVVPPTTRFPSYGTIHSLGLGLLPQQSLNESTLLQTVALLQNLTLLKSILVVPRISGHFLGEIGHGRFPCHLSGNTDRDGSMKKIIEEYQLRRTQNDSMPPPCQTFKNIQKSSKSLTEVQSEVSKTFC